MKIAKRWKFSTLYSNPSAVNGQKVCSFPSARQRNQLCSTAFIFASPEYLNALGVQLVENTHCLTIFNYSGVFVHNFVLMITEYVKTMLRSQDSSKTRSLGRWLMMIHQFTNTNTPVKFMSNCSTAAINWVWTHTDSHHVSAGWKVPAFSSHRDWHGDQASRVDAMPFGSLPSGLWWHRWVWLVTCF